MINQNLIADIKNQPLVSVGIPTYNRPEGLKRTLECITNQTYKNLEIIVSDNCSPGRETEAVIRDFMIKDNRIRYFHQEMNKGPSFNFKFVLEQANGEFFMWAADDDEWSLFYIEKIMKEFEILGKDFIALNFEAQYFNIEKFPFFPEGKAFYNYSSGSIFFRVLHILKYNYGNLVYSIYRMNSLKKIQHMIFVENEIPFMIQVVQYGNWRVIPEVGFFKKTNDITYNQAKWEICGGWLQKTDNSISHRAGTIYSHLGYHLKALNDIISSINSLSLPYTRKVILLLYTKWMIFIHFINLVVRYKRPHSRITRR